MLKWLRDLKWEALYRLHPKHRYDLVRTDLKPGYYDYDHRMLHACFALLVEYVEESGGREEILKHLNELKTSPWLWTGHQSGDPKALELMQVHIDKDTEILTLYDYWTVEHPAEQKKVDDMSAGEKWWMAGMAFEEIE